MKRTEINLKTGEFLEITVLAYKNTSNEVLILDEGVIPPSGYMRISDKEASQLTGPSSEQIVSAYTAHIQKRLDTFAKTRGYDSALSCCTYATSTVAKFAAEGQYMVEARDLTWAQAYEILADVESGLRPMPTLQELDAELPELVWTE